MKKILLPLVVASTLNFAMANDHPDYKDRICQYGQSLVEKLSTCEDFQSCKAICNDITKDINHIDSDEEIHFVSCEFNEDETDIVIALADLISAKINYLEKKYC
ncbi:MAG: hypothetical protein CMF42_00725 [Legionellales bacterium]|nr:hypothetical protein [Legionellales bacterium]OUX68283.1 MAG: hypothetical protein CBD38_00270 [bacterium TMED178]|tara:strand:- start:5912 stop:6223 length:312 start_codon:yes stop_codon:yes gene_type:complete